MKVRTDFVTNSSSSSFVIAYKTIEIDKDVLNKYPYLKSMQKLLDFIMESDGYETCEAEIFTTKEELESYILAEYSWGEYKTLDNIFEFEDWLKLMYDESLKYMADGYKIAFKQVGYGDTVGKLIDAFAENNDHFILIGEE